MKYFISRITLVMLLIVSYKSMFAMSKIDIYIENHYGAPIKFKKGASDSNAPEVSVANQARVWVGTVDNVNALSIRTTGTGSRFVSYFTELTAQLNQIKSEKDNNKNKDAIIIIKPSRSYQSWDMEIHWEKSGQDITNLDVEQNLMAIIDGSLGQNYAEKARAINDYDYTKATKRGQINLRTYLLKRIEETMVQTYKKVARRKGVWIEPELSTTEDLKNNIDMIHRSLQRYKAQDGQ